MRETRTVQGRLYGRTVAVDLEVLGPCPVCQEQGREGYVYENEAAYGCTNYTAPIKCPLTIWKTLYAKPLGEDVVLQLLTRTHTELIDGFSTRDGQRQFATRLCLTNGKVAKYEGKVDTAS